MWWKRLAEVIPLLFSESLSLLKYTIAVTRSYLTWPISLSPSQAWLLYHTTQPLWLARDLFWVFSIRLIALVCMWKAYGNSNTSKFKSLYLGNIFNFSSIYYKPQYLNFYVYGERVVEPSPFFAYLPRKKTPAQRNRSQQRNSQVNLSIFLFYRQQWCYSKWPPLNFIKTSGYKLSYKQLNNKAFNIWDCSKWKLFLKSWKKKGC